MNWLTFNSGKCDAAFNMAMDEALLQSAAQLGGPMLRFYGWTQPAATFGYFQKFSEVERITAFRPLIRRPTGGGIVPHNADWTYSFAVPRAHSWHGISAEESYRRVHDWLRLAFTELGVETELAPCCKKSLPGQCFVGHEKSDLLWRGKKIAGAAQRRNQLGLLIQGSVQPPPSASSREAFQTAMLRAAEKNFGATWKALEMPTDLEALAGKLAGEKYSQTCYNQKR